MCAAVLFALAACGGYAVPAAHVTNAKDAILAAATEGAGESPRGRLYFLTAQGEFQNAMQSNGKAADLLLLRSQVDAELALAMAREDFLKSQADQAVDRARSLSPRRIAAAARDA